MARADRGCDQRLAQASRRRQGLMGLAGGPQSMNQMPLSRRTTIGLGAIAAAIGFFIVLVGLGVLPPPGKANAPMWVVMLAGLCFLLGGMGVLVPAAVTDEVRSDGELPAGAPYWLRVFQYLLVLAIFAAFAVI